MLQLSVFPQQDFILARLVGLVSIEAWSAGLSELEAALGETTADRLVLDLTGLVGWLGVYERTQVGALWARHLSRMRKVAGFIERQKIVGVVETEARRLGLDMRLFPDQDEAVNWVLRD